MWGRDEQFKDIIANFMKFEMLKNEIEVIVLKNWLEIIYIVSNENIELIVLEASLYYLDILDLINNISRLTNYNNRYLVRTYNRCLKLECRLKKFKIKYIYANPFDFEKFLQECINVKLEVSDEKSPYVSRKTIGKEIDENIKEILNKYKIPMHLNGYTYLKNIIKEMYKRKIKNQQQTFKSLKNNIYHVVCEKYNISEENLDRSIRYSLKVSHKNMSKNMIIRDRSVKNIVLMCIKELFETNT